MTPFDLFTVKLRLTVQEYYTRWLKNHILSDQNIPTKMVSPEKFGGRVRELFSKYG